MARICVFCASSDRIDSAHIELATAVGEEIARRGHDLVWGGARVSMMGAVARAVRAGGRHTLGVLPTVFLPGELVDNDADELVVTPDIRQRKARMDEAADAFLTLPGGIGTLEELLEIWVSASVGMHNKPVVVLDPTGVYAPLRQLIEGLVEQGLVRQPAASVVVWQRDLMEALDALESGLGAPVPEPGVFSADVAEELLEAEP